MNKEYVRNVILVLLFWWAILIVVMVKGIAGLGKKEDNKDDKHSNK